MTAGPLFVAVTISDIRDVAVAITRYRRYYHACIFFKSAAQGLQICEIGLTGDIACRKFKPSEHRRYGWAIPPIDEKKLEQISDLCEAVDAKRVPYAFRYSRSTFAFPGGAFQAGDKTFGLTCATFVLAMFSTAGVELLDEASWQHRAEDYAWQDDVLANLLPRPDLAIPADEIEANRQALPCFRYRPEEVVAASQFTSRPVPMPVAEQAGKMIVAHLERSFEILGVTP